MVSKDGVIYTEVASGEEEFSETPSWVTVTCSPESSYQYIMIYVDGYYGSGGGINEIEAFGTLDNPGAPNVALGKPATASDSWGPTHGPDHVTDGSVLEEEIDYWILPSYTTGWVEVDLERIYDLTKIKWLNTHNDGYNDRATNDWQMEVSEDGKVYTEISGGIEGFSENPTWVVVHDSSMGEPITARYLRINVDSFYLRGGGINEIEAYGHEKNIALGQNTHASAIWGENFSASNVVDGSTEEVQEIDYWILPSYTNGWIQVELDGPYELSSIKWLNTHNGYGGYNDRATTDWRMAVSEDGVNFEVIGSGAEEFSEHPQWMEITDITESDNVRYVRLFVDNYYSRGGGANEIEVYARKKGELNNLALGKPCQASEQYNAAHAPGNIVDGSITEFEIDYWLLPSAATGWVEVDLESVYPLSEIRWLNTHNDGYNDRCATNWSMEVSEDGIVYTQVANGIETFTPTPTWVVVPLAEEDARYIRFYVDGYSGLGGGINELEVYGSED